MKEKTYSKARGSVLNGLTGAMLSLSYTICMCAVTGIPLLGAFLCICVCALFCARMKKGFFVPDILLLLPVYFYTASAAPLWLLPGAILGGILISLVFFRLSKKNNFTFLPGALGIALALALTILLTDNYFGIGSFGSTPWEMLKNYRYLGFHPNFSGLLYGTITLFAMITFPFKFRDINKKLPAEFLTLLVPLLINLLLNPVKELSVINELHFTPLSLTGAKEMLFAEPSLGDFSVLLKTALITGCCFFILNSNKEDNKKLITGNALSVLFSGFPVRKTGIHGYTLLSAVITITVSAFVIFACTPVLCRIPEHCAGAMLIVAAWQRVPYKSLSFMKGRNPILSVIFIIIICAAFVFADTLTASIVALVIAESGASEGAGI